MDRIEALAYIDGVMGATFAAAGRARDDSPEGFGPVLDQAFGMYITENGLSTSLTETVVPPEDEYCFRYLLVAISYDYVMPYVGMTEVDFSVDAPLTSVKHSQKYRQMENLANSAWEKAGACGYGRSTQEFGGFKVHFDYNEPEAETSGVV